MQPFKKNSVWVFDRDPYVGRVIALVSCFGVIISDPPFLKEDIIWEVHEAQLNEGLGIIYGTTNFTLD